MYEEFYLDKQYVPKIFLDADKVMESEYKPLKENKPIEKPMPRIEGVPGVKGPLYVTEDWYIEKQRKRELKRLKEQKAAQIEMINLLAQKDCLRHKIGKLDPSKKRDAKRIAAMNVRIRDIDAELRFLEIENDCKVKDIDRGTKFGRVVGHVKRFTRKIGKKIKKFYNRNVELVNGMATMLIPVITSLIIKSLLA